MSLETNITITIVTEEEASISFTKAEANIIQKALGIAIYNGNHAQPKAFVPNGKEYPILCKAFNKVYGVK